MADHAGIDRTRRAVVAQIGGMGCADYEIGVRDRELGRMIPRRWNAEQVERGTSWLQRMNAQGHDIYVRPSGSVGLVLVDDLAAAAVDRMRRDGIPPAVVVQTSPGNHQVWVRLSEDPLPPEDATTAAKELVRRYGGDRNSADWRHFGRLAGFTNRKAEHRRADGEHPYVLLVDASGARATHALAGLLTSGAREKAGPVAPAIPRTGQGRGDASLGPPGESYINRARPLLERYPHADYSRLDWMVLRDMASSSLAVDQEYLEQALREGSPKLEERKVGHVDEYVRRTARKVLDDPHVVAACRRLVERQSGVEL